MEHIKNDMTDSLTLIQRRIARIERQRTATPTGASPLVPTGLALIDRALGGGWARGKLHELIVDAAEAGSGSGFAAVIARLIGGEMLWLNEETAWRQMGAPNGAGLTAIGLDPAKLVVALLPEAATVLRAAADALRCPALGVVVITLWGTPPVLDLTATRRLLLAAEQSGVTPLLLRLGGKSMPSAAQTRWRVAAAPSRPLAANAPGHPAWDLELLRQRGRPDGGLWRVEWDREQRQLRDWHEPDGAALPGTVAALPADRPAGAGPGLRQAG